MILPPGEGLWCATQREKSLRSDETGGGHHLLTTHHAHHPGPDSPSYLEEVSRGHRRRCGQTRTLSSDRLQRRLSRESAEAQSPQRGSAVPGRRFPRIGLMRCRRKQERAFSLWASQPTTSRAPILATKFSRPPRSGSPGRWHNPPRGVERFWEDVGQGRGPFSGTGCSFCGASVSHDFFFDHCSLIFFPSLQPAYLAREAGTLPGGYRPPEKRICPTPVGRSDLRRCPLAPTRASRRLSC